MPTRRRRAGAPALLFVAALVGLCVAPGTARADGRPPANPQERAAALIRPAVMYLAGQGYGLVRLPNGRILSQFGEGTTMPFIAVWNCTAFTVNPDGWVATAGHCVDPESAKSLILKRAADEYIRQFPAAPESQDPAAAVEYLQKNARVEGDTAGGQPQISFTLLYGTGVNVAGKIPANVVDFRPLDRGDVALLKVEKHGLPSSELAADADVNIGTPILSVGYAESTRHITGATLDPTNKSGTVSKKSNLGSNPEYETDAPSTEGMSGGPTVALNGKVIGVNSFAPVGEPQPFNFVAPSDSLAAILAGKGLKAGLGPADAAYRRGLSHYYAGHYSEAIDDFNAALAMSPDYPGLVDLRTSAANLQQRYGDASILRGATLVWYTIFGVLLVLAVGALLTYALVRRRVPLLSRAKRAGLRLVRVRSTARRADALTDTAPPVASPHFCSACGEQHHADETFCPNCGKRIVIADAALGAS